MKDERYRMIARLHEIRCAGCLNTIEGALRRRGAESVKIDLGSHIVEVVYQGRASDADAYCAAVRATGYQATLLGVVLQNPGADGTDG
ncbi:MAG: heavy metal-associated domain-containing protein [Bacillota bacterium]|nr:heavy metal-associated domain-containing protein [Bacillota bacterium]